MKRSSKSNQAGPHKKYLFTLFSLTVVLTIAFIAWAQGQSTIPDPGHSANQIGAGSLNGDVNFTGKILARVVNASNMTVNDNLNVTGSLGVRGNLSINANVSVLGSITFPNSGEAIRLPYKWYVCSVTGAITGSDTHTWVDGDCSQDAGVPSDNARCFMGTASAQTGGGTVFNFACNQANGFRFTPSLQNFNLVCHYLCW